MDKINVQRYTQAKHRVILEKGETSFPKTSLSDQLKIALDERGIILPDNSRFSPYVNKTIGQVKNEKSSLCLAQDSAQLLVALNHIEDLSQWNSTLSKALRYDPIVPQSGIPQTKGRDSLFELYVAGRLQAINAKVSKGEPDIICSWQGNTFSVAAKRIKSKNKILTRVREARKQIVKSKYPGIIALDLAPLSNDFFADAGTIPVSQHRKTAFNCLNKEFEPLLPQINDICRHKRVFGIIAFTTIARFVNVEKPMLHCTNHHSGHRLCKPSSEKARLMWNLVDQLSTNFGHNSK